MKYLSNLFLILIATAVATPIFANQPVQAQQAKLVSKPEQKAVAQHVAGMTVGLVLTYLSASFAYNGYKLSLLPQETLEQITRSAAVPIIAQNPMMADMTEQEENEFMADVAKKLRTAFCIFLFLGVPATYFSAKSSLSHAKELWTRGKNLFKNKNNATEAS